jgi:hypothetical protein
MKRLGFLAFVIGVGACTTHGEGGRCDPQNINSSGQFADCDNGLACIDQSDIVLPEGGASNASICCPATPADRQALLLGDICYLPPNTPGSDASIPDANAEGGEDGGSDAPINDAQSDATDAAGE